MPQLHVTMNDKMYWYVTQRAEDEEVNRQQVIRDMLDLARELIEEEDQKATGKKAATTPGKSTKVTKRGRPAGKKTGKKR